MYAEDIIAAVLKDPRLATATGGRIALVQLPQDSGYPGIVYSAISDNPLPRMCKPGVTYKARIQINPLATTVRAMLDLHDLVRQVLESYTPKDATRSTESWSDYYFAGFSKILACVYEGAGPTSKDDYTGAWTKPFDYMLLYETRPPETPPQTTPPATP